MAKQRKWLPTLGELIDRLSIHQLKEVFIPENKDNYAKEMNDMVHDIDMRIGFRLCWRNRKCKSGIAASLAQTGVFTSCFSNWFRQRRCHLQHKRRYHCVTYRGCSRFIQNNIYD